MRPTPTAKTTKGLFDGVFFGYAEAKAELLRRRADPKTVRELGALTDQPLNDIGVERDEISLRAYEGIYH
ncbi:DUF1127 domain-containing protein [Ruegeria sp. EL01]|jgi:hypothetical protein|uniref:DUF1127 domain-containing protein n=1 Tax=Ruegeria sp. EL01 TaxID=2107578 RepID=UPI000EA821F9|nr:DUF1127 domain-containing protein [Ruegeria sp. EL01]